MDTAFLRQPHGTQIYYLYKSKDGFYQLNVVAVTGLLTLTFGMQKPS